MRMLRYLWALPASLVGLLLGFAALLLGARSRLVCGALEISGGRLRSLIARLPEGIRFGAITFGHVIVGVDAGALDRARSHEHVHVRQYERWGLFFFPLYLGSSLVQLVRGRDPYWDNRFEVEAYSKERRTT